MASALMVATNIEGVNMSSEIFIPKTIGRQGGSEEIMMAECEMATDLVGPPS